MTRQTVQGRANNGGLRVGEMDRDCVIAHGLNYFLNESMMVRGDEFYMAICNKSGTVAIYNEKNNLFLSPFVDGPVKFVTNVNNEINIKNVSKFGKDFSIVRVPYAFKLLMQELQAMNVQMRIITEDNVDALTTLKESDNIVRLTKFNDLAEIANENKKQILESEKDNFFKETTILVEKEAPTPIKNTTIVDVNVNMGDDGEWGDNMKLPMGMGMAMGMPEQVFLDTITVGDATINVGDMVKVEELNRTFGGDYTFKVVEITQEKDMLDRYNFKLEDVESGDFKFIQDITKLEKIPENNIPKPNIAMNIEETPDDSPKSPSYNPFSPTQGLTPNTPESINPTINAPMDTDFLEQEDYESTDDEDDDDTESEEDESKPKITIINEGEMDDKDLEILTVDDINERNKEREEENEGDSSVKKGIKIDA
jgi:hypothetical protein